VSTQTLAIAAPAPPRRWVRLLAPSLGDVYFVTSILWLFAAGAYGWHALLADGDVGTHIRIGDYILAYHRVPTHDFLAFSKPGQEWYAFEWLTEVLFSRLHAFAGLKGVVLFSGVVIVASYTLLLLQSLWRGGNIVISLVLVLMAVNASSIHFLARPHIFTLLFVSAAMWLIAADRLRRTPALWLIVPMVVAWTNLHGGFFVLFALLGLLVAGSLAEWGIWGEFAARRKSDAVRYALLGAACAAASLINPYGLKLHLFLVDYLRSDRIRDGVREFQSPSFRGENMLLYMVLLFLALALTGVLLRKRRLTEVLWLWFLGYNSLVSVRHVPLFAIVAAPILAGEITALWSRWVQARPSRSIARTLDAVTAQYQCRGLSLGLWAPAVTLWLAFSQGAGWPRDFLEGPFPVKIVAAHADEIAASRVFTSDGWAGYLIYKNYPRQKVFFDDRHHYFGEPIIGDYLKIGGGSRQWRELMNRYGLDHALVGSDSPIASLLRLEPDWTAVQDDGSAVLFRRNVR
jgi:hypothetical protein